MGASQLWMADILLTVLLGYLTIVKAYTTVSDDTLRKLPAAGADFDIHNGAILSPILVPRVAGTPGSTMVQSHLVNWFANNLPNWKIEYQNSTSKTPVSNGNDVPFVNLIMTRDPPWAQPGEVGRLNLVAHYDSKLTPEGFIGATDSAVPVAILMHAARSVDEALTRKWTAMKAAGAGDGLDEEIGLQIIFLDGEEAFVNWTDDDSLYGARALAQEWEHKPHTSVSTHHNHLSSIDLFLLLDLLGAKNPSVKSYFKTTHWAYQHMAKLETRLREQKLLLSKPFAPFFTHYDESPPSFMGGMIQDDHIPFLVRGVEVLHIIPTPFPPVWHEMTDDGEHLDLETSDDWARIVTAFVGEWMDLEGCFPDLPKPVLDTRNDGHSRKLELP